VITGILKNKIFSFILLRYIAYGLQFIGTLVIAYKLGPAKYGIWAYILVIFQFFSLLNFGIPNALNNLISIHKHHRNYLDYTLSVGFFLLVLNVLFSILLYGAINWFGLLDWKDNDLGDYTIHFLLIIILVYCNTLFLNIFRVFNELLAINIYQLILPLTLFIVAISFSSEEMIKWLLFAYLFSNIISLIIFIFKFPHKFQFKLKFRIFSKVIVKALRLFVYNTSFYFIFLSSRYIISESYPQDVFGQFAFALTISMVLVLILDSFSFLIFPKLINKYSKMTNDGIKFFEDIRLDYVTISHFLMHGAIMLYGVLVVFFIDYSSTFNLFVILCMAHAIFSLGYGYSILLMSKEKDSLLALISLTGLIVNIGVILAFIYLKLPFTYAGISILISYLTMVIILNFHSNRILHESTFGESFKRLFSLNFILPIIAALSMVIINVKPFFFIFSFLIFLILNTQRFKAILKRVKEIVHNPSLIDLK
jgi:O-antigen/teichoic acid export membrane protein